MPSVDRGPPIATLAQRRGRVALRALARRFGRDRKGATAVEFALIAVPLFGIIAVIFNTGFAYLFERGLDAAAQGAARQVRIGAVQAAGISTAQDYATKYVCTQGNSLLKSLIDCSKLIVDARTSTAFTNNDLSNDFYKTQASNKFCLGAPSQITVIRVTYPMPWFIPVLAIGPLDLVVNRAGLVNDVPSSPGTWNVLLTAVSVLRTEPYPQQQYSPPSGC